MHRFGKGGIASSSSQPGSMATPLLEFADRSKRKKEGALEGNCSPDPLALRAGADGDAPEIVEGGSRGETRSCPAAAQSSARGGGGLHGAGRGGGQAVEIEIFSLGGRSPSSALWPARTRPLLPNAVH